jgi:hypothetical protein
LRETTRSDIVRGFMPQPGATQHLVGRSMTAYKFRLRRRRARAAARKKKEKARAAKRSRRR